jgi:hypothetical protein
MPVELVVLDTGMMVERTTTERICGNIMEKLQADALASGVLVPQVLPRTDIMFLKDKQVMVAQRLTELPMNTAFSLDSSKKVVWANFHERDDEVVQMKVDWKCPTDMHLMLLASGPLYEYQQNAWSFFVVAVCEQGKEEEPSHRGVWMLPLPNQYEDGRMCFNVNLVNPREKIAGWQDVFSQALTLLSTAKWAADPLFTEWKITPAKKLFRWKNETGYEQLESPSDISHWTKCCRQISVSSLTSFFTQWSLAYDIKL